MITVQQMLLFLKFVNNQIGYHKDTICRVATYISGYNLQPIPICKKIYCK